MRAIVYALVLLVSVSAGGCKQGDGSLPAKTGDVPNRISDLKRDLETVVAGDQAAIQDLADDLIVFTEEPEGHTAIRALANTVGPMLVKRVVNDEAMTRIATVLWTAAAGNDLSERQVDALKDEMRNVLMSVGVTQPDANLAAGRVGEVQKAVTQRARHWYERY
jgi:uncharacterized protein YgfB (UPF0149 family)